MKKLIGVHGKKGSGKDTVAMLIAQYVHRELSSREVVVKHYADALKCGLAAMFTVPIQNFYEESLKEQVIPGLGASPRELMTRMHDLLVPLYGDQIWVNPIRDDYCSRWLGNSREGLYVVADVRYDGRETDWIRKEGGHIIHVVRASTDVNAGKHSSEMGVEVHQEDWVIHNDETLLHLRMEVWGIMSKIMG